MEKLLLYQKGNTHSTREEPLGSGEGDEEKVEEKKNEKQAGGRMVGRERN